MVKKYIVKNKTQALKALSLKNIWNKTAIVNNIIIRTRMWDENSYQVVDSKDFNSCNVLKSFYYKKELAEYIISNS